MDIYMFPLLLIRIQELFDKKLSHIDFRTEFADQGKSLQGIPVFFGYFGKNALGMFDGFQNVIFYRGQVFFDVSGNRFINSLATRMAFTILFFAYPGCTLRPFT